MERDFDRRQLLRGMGYAVGAATVATIGGSATATAATSSGGPPPVVGDSTPMDLDGDGLYEDINGDGQFDLLDVRLLFTNRDTTVVQNNAAAFDFSGSGGAVGLLDVRALYLSYQQGPEWTPIAERDIATESTGATIRVSDYGASPDTGEDVSNGILNAFAAASKEGATVVFEEGEYLLGAGRNDTSVRETPPLFDLEGYTDLTIEGNGAVLKPRHWSMSFRPIQCSNLTIRDLTIDWERDLPMSEGHVVEETADYVDLELREGFAAREGLPVRSFYFWDEQNGRVQYPLYHADAHETPTAVPEDGVLRCPKGEDTPAEMTIEGEPIEQGKALIIRHVAYGGSAMRSYECEGVTMENVTCYSNPGMGFYLKHTADVTATNVGLETKGDNWMGNMADGFHLKNAYGDYELRDITIEGTGDDWLALPIYRHDVATIEGTTVTTASRFSRLHDIEYHGFREGDTVAIATSPNLLEPAFTATVTNAETTIEDDRGHTGVGYFSVDLDATPPDDIMDADTVQLYHQGHLPDSILIDNATVGPIRGGARLRSPNVTIQNSDLDGANLLWFHAQPRGVLPDNGTIRDNTIDGGRVLVVDGNDITIENNTFAHDTSDIGVEVRTNNVTVASNDFSNWPGQNIEVAASDCETVTVDGESACDR
jgi:hypothetical protein